MYVSLNSGQLTKKIQSFFSISLRMQSKLQTFRRSQSWAHPYIPIATRHSSSRVAVSDFHSNEIFTLEMDVPNFRIINQQFLQRHFSFKSDITGTQQLCQNIANEQSNMQLEIVLKEMISRCQMRFDEELQF